MKKALRIIVPLLLVIAVIGCVIWYLFDYDRIFTRDMLLQQARNMDTRGYHAVAQWFYGLAYSHADNDENVAIELAELYKEDGNFTKAEYTLSQAISDGGTAELYIALCKTYVQQDKLLDAVNMLDNIADPAIKAELEAMRPSAPVASPEPGFYNEYITVELSSSAGTLYARTDGQYPSTADTPYRNGIPLEGGETTVYTLSIADNGLVSPLSIFGYTVSGVIEPVVFCDAAVEAEVRSILGVNETKVVYTNELWSLEEFHMPQQATTYEDLKFMPYLEKLTIHNGISEELHHMTNLLQLQELTITGCSPSESDMVTIGTMPLLKRLTMNDCGLSTIKDLASLQNLEYLDISDNTVANLSAMMSMPKVKEAILSHNAISDLTDLGKVTTLEVLDLSYNSITSIAPICTLKGITTLKLDYNMLTDLAAIDNITSLTIFSAANNSIEDVTPLGNCTELTELDISSNQIKSIENFSSLVNLVNFNFSDNQVSKLPEFPKDCALVLINGNSNKISSLSNLSNLENLNKVYMRFNEELSSVSPLGSCPKLVEVDVWGTKVTSKTAKPLTDQSIIVNYDPTLGKDYD